MTTTVLLDTHIALWLDSGDQRLRPSTRTLIDRCWHDGGTILLSAVSAWEIALLVDGERIVLDCPVETWIDRFLDRPGVQGADISLRSASRSYRLPDLEHRDPADRLLMATAIELRCPLVTYDDWITRFAARHGEALGFTVAA